MAMSEHVSADVSLDELEAAGSKPVLVDVTPRRKWKKRLARGITLAFVTFGVFTTIDAFAALTTSKVTLEDFALEPSGNSSFAVTLGGSSACG